MDGSNYTGYTRMQSLTDTNWAVARVGDYDGDGQPDVWWRNRATGDTKLWVMHGVTVAGESNGPAEPNLDWQIGSGQ
jgi:hypothetical protein